MTRVAIIGAGISGLVVARELQGNHSVTVFEKSRGFGGRMASRYDNEFEFDHGAQFFTAKTPDFRRYLQPLIDNGSVASWHARFAEIRQGEIVSRRDWDDDFPHFVGAPRMNAIGKFLAKGLEVRRNTTVTRLERESGRWRLKDNEGSDLGCFDWVVLAMPAAQAATLAQDNSRLCKLTAAIEMRACFALMLGFDTPLRLPWQAALVHDADVSWISVNSSKPGRPAPYTLVVHSTNAFADANIDNDIDDVIARLLAETGNVLGENVDHAASCRLQRWRYANAGNRDGDSFFVDESVQLAACGDWFMQGRVEAAFTSGFGLAKKLVHSHLPDRHTKCS